jgi:hypothetical protein
MSKMNKQNEVLMINNVETKIKDWTKADDNGEIHVPDQLDKLVNSIGMQFKFVSISGKNEGQAICDIAYKAQLVFTEIFKEKLLEETYKMKRQLGSMDDMQKMNTYAKIDFIEIFCENLSLV